MKTLFVMIWCPWNEIDCLENFVSNIEIVLTFGWSHVKTNGRRLKKVGKMKFTEECWRKTIKIIAVSRLTLISSKVACLLGITLQQHAKITFASGVMWRRNEICQHMVSNICFPASLSQPYLPAASAQKFVTSEILWCVSKILRLTLELFLRIFSLS